MQMTKKATKQNIANGVRVRGIIEKRSVFIELCVEKNTAFCSRSEGPDRGGLCVLRIVEFLNMASN